MRPIRIENWQISAKRTGKKFGATDSDYESLRYGRKDAEKGPSRQVSRQTATRCFDRQNQRCFCASHVSISIVAY